MAVIVSLGLMVAYAQLRGFIGMEEILSRGPGLLFVVIAAVVLFGAGLADDLIDIRPRTKLLFQTVAAVGAIIGGVEINRVAIPLVGTVTLPDAVAMPLTLLWIVGLTNAFNLIDGIDGLSSGVGAIVLAALAVLFELQGAAYVPLGCAMLAGSLLGFFSQNVSRRRIFLGDGGAFVAGFAVASLSILAARDANGAISPGVVLLLCALPVADTALVIIRRAMSGRSILTADRMHLHHLLTSRGLGQRGALFVLLGVTTTCSVWGCATALYGWRIGLLAAAGAGALLAVAAYAVAPAKARLTWRITDSLVRAPGESIANWSRFRQLLMALRKAESVDQLCSVAQNGLARYGVTRVLIAPVKGPESGPNGNNVLTLKVPLRRARHGVGPHVLIDIDREVHGHLDELHGVLDWILPCLEDRLGMLAVAEELHRSAGLLAFGRSRRAQVQ